MLQTSNYSLVLFLQFLLLFYDLFVNSFSELLRTAPAVQLVLFIIQDIAILFNVIIIFLMFFNTFVFQAGLVNLLFHKFKGTILLSAAYLALSISFHIWIMGLGRGPIPLPRARFVTEADPGMLYPHRLDRRLVGICRDLKSEARIGPDLLAKSPELLNLWSWHQEHNRPCGASSIPLGPSVAPS
ncbi:transmembrane protein 138 isoform X1 [Phasianus colchicus]|uniref:transmembrane protein 138 isoform X1 n=1 Tax=Phasianus colchicus TaxID=9054 RepID=UPI00129EF58F|nr:transmembrane protein 138 isoform X1 [Phasianus colchicus]